MSLTIRPAVRADAPALTGMMREFCEHHNDPHDLSPDKLRGELLEREPEFSVLMAEWDGTPAGFAITNTGFEITAAERGTYISDIHVCSVFRRKGIARALFAHIAAQARAEDRTFLWWFARQNNAEAEGFYATLGTKTERVMVHALVAEQFEALAGDVDS